MAETAEATPSSGGAEQQHEVSEHDLHESLTTLYKGELEGSEQGLLEDKPKSEDAKPKEEDRPETGDDPGEEPEAKDAEDDQSEEGEEPEGADDALEVDAEVLASALGLDEDGISVDDSGALQVRVKVDGEESFVTPSQLLRGYQTDVHNTRRSEQIAKDRREFDSERTSHFQHVQQTMQGLQAVEQALIQSFEADYQQIDWQALRQDDPAQYAALQQDMAQRKQNLGTLIEQGRQYQQQIGQQQMAQSAQQIQALKAQNLQRLHEAMPELRDSTRFADWKGQISGYLQSQGFREDEIKSTVDARAILLAEKARKWDESQKEGKAIEQKKVRKNVRVLKSGKPKSDVSGKAKAAKRQQSLIEKARRTQSDQDWTQVVLDRLGPIGQ